MLSISSSTADEAAAPEISTVHPEIVQSHILTRLDGPTLASMACASSHLRSLSSDDTLWRQICNQTWPSTTDPSVRHIISSFPSGHRSFYYDSYPGLCSRQLSPTSSFTTFQDVSFSQLDQPLPIQTRLISAVNLRYQDRLILSRVHQTETKTGWFMSSPFRVDILVHKETLQTDIQPACLEKDLLLSWIMVDLTRCRAANFASLRPVSVSRHWLTGDLHVRYVTVLSLVQCAAVVTCRSEEGGEVHVKEVSFVVEDFEGRSLSGKETLTILQDAMENGARRRRGDGDEEKERYDNYLAMKKEMMGKKQWKETRMDMVCVFTVVTLAITWAFFLLKIST